MKREYPLHPIPGVGAVLIKDKRVLLVRRRHEPGKGLWSIPGGVIEVGEPVKEAAIREVKEETGFDITVEEPLGVTDVIIRDKKERVKFHYILVSFRARIVGGSIAEASAKSEIRWASRAQIETLPITETALKLLKKTSFIQGAR
ncbi:NUDIX hydrolase [[Eubacterium] cellulosolvens]